MKILNLLESFPLALKEFGANNDIETVKDAITRFRGMQSSISDPKQKDINYWRKAGFDRFLVFVDALEMKDTKRKRARKVKAASDDILTVKKTANSHLFVPLSKEATCFYGSEVPWCISTRDAKNFFYAYTVSWNFVIFLLTHESDVYALVINPKDGKVKECQDKINDNSFPVDKFLQLSGVSMEDLMQFISYNYDSIFAKLQGERDKDTEQEIKRQVANLRKILIDYFSGDEKEKEAALRYTMTAISLFRAQTPRYDELFKKHFEDKVATDARLAAHYAKTYLQGRFVEAEPVIATNAIASIDYAMAIDGPFPAGESAIATDAELSLNYAYRFKHGKFKAGEPAIAKSRMHARVYASYSADNREAMLKLGAEI